MSRLLMVAAGLEAVTGMALLIDPGLAALWLLGAGLSDAGTAVGRVAGCSLVALGWACWPPQTGPAGSRPGQALLIYNVLVTMVLVCLGIGGSLVGPLLWPAAAVHAGLTTLLARACFGPAQAAQP